MSRLNLNNDLFLGLQELNRQNKFYKDDGYIRLLKSIINDFGIVRVNIDSTFLNFKVQGGTNTGTIKIGTDSYAIDEDLNIIFQRAIDNIAITDDSNWYWVKISYQESNIEEGTISVATNGNITGTGTKFSEVLRDQSNYPVKINFPSSVLNTGDYQVTSVLSDTQAIIAGASGFTSENDLDYKVVGSFTPGINPSGDDRLPYFYDSCNLELILETVSDTPPVKTTGTEFYIARARNVGGTMTIQDKRTEFVSTETRRITSVNVSIYDVTPIDNILHVIYPSTGAVTSLTLLSAEVIGDNREIFIKDASGNANTNNITIDTEGSETIDGVATKVINSNYGHFWLYSYGGNWFTK